MEDYKKLIEDCTHYIKDENTNSWDVIEVSDLEEIMQAYHKSKVKNLGLFSVSQQRELLLAYERHHAQQRKTELLEGDLLMIEDFLKANNCG